MTITPNVTPMNVLEQGGAAFPYAAKWVDTVHLAANTNADYSLTTLRSNAGLGAGQPLFVIFSADGPFWANFRNTAAAIPSGSTTDGSSAEFSPNQRYLDGSVTDINMIASAITNVSMQIFRP